MNILLKELKNFSKTNWWIYIIFIICLLFIYKTNSWNILEISFVFILHFMWDLFVMMMVHYYSQNEAKKWTISQIWAFIMFFIVWLYAWLKDWKWSYMIPQITFLLPNLKWVLQNFYNKTFRFLDYRLSILFWAFIFSLYFYLWMITDLWVFVQILWFIFFPLWLMIDNEKRKYFISMIWIWLITIWSAFFLYNWYLESNITWVDLSYTLLPLTVFIFYIKNIRNYL